MSPIRAGPGFPEGGGRSLMFPFSNQELAWRREDENIYQQLKVRIKFTTHAAVAEYMFILLPLGRAQVDCTKVFETGGNCKVHIDINCW
jgi:hypothetical protein